MAWRFNPFTKTLDYYEAGSVAATPGGISGQAQYNNGGAFGAFPVYWNSSNNRVGIITSAPNETLDVLGNFQVKDADVSTKRYRFRTSGSDLDFDAAGRDLYISNFQNADYSGTQRMYIRLEAGTQLLHFIGKTIFDTGPFGGGVITIDPTAGLTISNNLLFWPAQAATAAAPTYSKGAIYFDTTLNKLRVGGATGWETITST